jgi:hypothetical protein
MIVVLIGVHKVRAMVGAIRRFSHAEAEHSGNDRDNLRFGAGATTILV